jgi:hypothetical protein
LDATETAAATNGILDLPSNANVIRLTNNNAISGVSGGVLGAFYYLVNQTTNAVTISNVGGITVQGGTPLTLGANQAATLVATGATNASVANRGDLNDVALGGTANTAPSQTASSGASLMTRDLVDQAYMATPNALQLGAIAGATNGTGAGVIIGFNMAGDARLRPGGSTNGYASAYFVKNISGGAAAIASSRINFAQSIDVSGQLRMTTASNVDTKVRFIVGANSSSAVPASADALAFSNAGFGFEIDSLTNSLIKRVRLIYHDGSTNRQSEYHNFATNDFLNNVIMSYRIVSQAGNIQLYFLASATLEGALPLVSGPVISVTNGPATTNSSDHSAILVSAAQDSVTYTNHAIAVFSPIKLRQN